MGRQTTLKHLQIYLPDGMRDVISEVAHEQGYKVISDYVRDVLESDIKKYRPDISLTIKRGKQS